jgi:transcription initiation factor TFIIF subunit alpha
MITCSVGGKGGKKYKGLREGGVSDNTTFYVFTHGKDGAFEAFPIKDWYTISAIVCFTTLHFS